MSHILPSAPVIPCFLNDMLTKHLAVPSPEQAAWQDNEVGMFQTSYADLVSRLTDLKALAIPPPAGEKTALASSYDRKSQYDAINDTYIDWGANGDNDGIIRMECDNAVMADIQGPGCIWRIWSARPQAGHVKIYLDGNTTPAVDLPFTAYFDGSQPPFNRPALVYTTNAEGWNNYTPISFQKSCKIVAENGWGEYYHFNFTQFPPNTVVPTFHLPLSPADTDALDQANDLLLHLGQNPNSKSPTDEVIRQQITAESGKTTTIYDVSGSGAITGLRVKFNLPTDIEAQRMLLRQLALRITWDNESQPAVWSPLGDFLGTPAGSLPFESLPAGLGKDGYWYSYWYMPFGTHATLSIDNDGATALPMEWEITRAKLTQHSDSLLRFHAKWHRDAFLPRADRNPDWTLLTTQGKGRFVGTQLHIYNGRGDWWGEGDEKFFVDGEKFPSTFGTGSEDYFGYAWGNPEIFSHPFHGQPYKEYDISKSRHPSRDGGHVSNYRWHISDNIPFQTGFEGAIEKYVANEDRCTFYAAVAYWYLNPAGTDPYPIVPVRERVGYCVRPPVYHAQGVIEAAELTWLNPTRPSVPAAPNRGTAEVVQVNWGIPSNVASNDSFRRVQIKDIGSKVEFSGLKVETAGTYDLKARIFKVTQSGIYQISVDGVPVGEPLDFYAAKSPEESFMSPENTVEIGKVELAAGDHVLAIVLVGSNEDAKPDRGGRFECCLDYVKLEPSQRGSRPKRG